MVRSSFLASLNGACYPLTIIFSVLFMWGSVGTSGWVVLCSFNKIVLQKNKNLKCYFRLTLGKRLEHVLWMVY